MWAVVIGAIIIGILCSCSESDSYRSSTSGAEAEDDNDIRVFGDGTWDTKGIFGERQRSNGTYSYKDFWDREVTSEGKIIDQNGLIWDKSTGERIGVRWTDVFGVVHDEIDK